MMIYGSYIYFDIYIYTFMYIVITRTKKIEAAHLVASWEQLSVGIGHIRSQ